MKPFPVLYRWREGRAWKHGRSVAKGRTQAEARARFFRQHPHVQPLNP